MKSSGSPFHFRAMDVHTMCGAAGWHPDYENEELTGHERKRQKTELMTHERKRQKTELEISDSSDPFVFRDMLHSFDHGKYGSVTKDIVALSLWRMQLLHQILIIHPTLALGHSKIEKRHMEPLESEIPNATLSHPKVIDLDEDDIKNKPSAVTLPIVILDSDDDGSPGLKPPHHSPEIVPVKPPEELKCEDLAVSRSVDEVTKLKEDRIVFDDVKVERERILFDDIKVERDRGEYVGVENDEDIPECMGQYCQANTEDDGFGDIWNEMTINMECSKNLTINQPYKENKRDNGDCEHSFLLKDDLGYVCRVCGIIDKKIETIIDFQFAKSTSSRTYASESMRNKEEQKNIPGSLSFTQHDFTTIEISAHPRHMKQMKEHQIEGFNFLLSNLVTENPGGCILAHAPGSGKTFMIISFMQSFLTKYPSARPLVVLPKGILATWKREFLRWQIEDIPLIDLYSIKAESRSQQLEVLQNWVEQKSILFLGYKQFSSMVCHNDTAKVAVTCEEILLKAPTLLILDEGHTPRNEDTDVLQSLAKVQTPRKVVLSGTLYQNHVKEVFNILNLVRPRFLKSDTSRTAVKRIMGKAQFPSSRKHIKPGLDSAFYEVVEHTLHKDEDFHRRGSVIRDLREMTCKVLHYYKGDFLDELPGLVDFTVILNPTPQQKREAGKIKCQRKFRIASLGSAIYLHPGLSRFSERSSVTDDVMDSMLGEIDVTDGVKAKFFINLLNLCVSANEKLLVFSQYLLPLKFLERLAMKRNGWSLGREIFVISGESTVEERERAMDCLNNSTEARAFFGSIKACGEGISLVGASRLLFLDVHLNPSVTRQAIGRAYRPGQVKKVYVYRMIAADSPEEEDHITCFRKELISKMWFEWNEYCGRHKFQMETVDVSESGDVFLESPLLSEDVKQLYRR